MAILKLPIPNTIVKGIIPFHIFIDVKPKPTVFLRKNLIIDEDVTAFNSSKNMLSLSCKWIQAEHFTIGRTTYYFNLKKWDTLATHLLGLMLP